MTKKISDYLEHAKDCRLLAKQAKVEEHREMLVKMAASCEMLAQSQLRRSGVAKDAERFAQRVSFSSASAFVVRVDVIPQLLQT